MPPRPAGPRSAPPSPPRRHAGGPGPSLGAAAVVAGALVAVPAGLLLGFRAAGLVLALVLVTTALSRACLPATSPAVLVVRSRGVDVATASLLALGVAVLALTAPA